MWLWWYGAWKAVDCAIVWLLWRQAGGFGFVEHCEEILVLLRNVLLYFNLEALNVGGRYIQLRVFFVVLMTVFPPPHNHKCVIWLVVVVWLMKFPTKLESWLKDRTPCLSAISVLVWWMVEVRQNLEEAQALAPSSLSFSGIQTVVTVLLSSEYLGISVS